MTEVNEWKMTEKESEELVKLESLKQALNIMAESQFHLAHKIGQTENKLWSKIAQRLGVKPKGFPPLKADIGQKKIYR